jgi:CelD/BcsL family acetyltransferase involved in cellulose biosynthesis
VEQATNALQIGQLRLLVLWLDDCPACVWFTFLYNRRVFFQACSYKPEYANLRLGKVMMAYAVRQAIEDGAIEYDMKRGDADYKYHWANGERHTVQINATPRTLRGALLHYCVYGSAAVRGWKQGRRVYEQIRRGGRWLLAPIARRWPQALPPGLGERLLQRTRVPDESHVAFAE